MQLKMQLDYNLKMSDATRLQFKNVRYNWLQLDIQVAAYMIFS
jgi:hypothetical protein